MTRFILDSGNPQEYTQTASLLKEKGSELWGATTNPSLIAKQLNGQKLTREEAFTLQKDIILEIVEIVPGAVSAEVYADHETKASEMIEQGRQIASWHERVVVKLPTTLEGFKARTELRKDNILVNNTLVFSQEQIFAICLHEQLVQKEFGLSMKEYPSFISPFVGRLDDTGIDGIQLVQHGMQIKKQFDAALTPGSSILWMLEASVRSSEHMDRGILAGVELITVPMKAYTEYFSRPEKEHTSLDNTAYAKELTALPAWTPPSTLMQIQTLTEFMQAIEADTLPITHELTDKGITKFVEDWNSILTD